jgi:uncharacterized protein (TIGR03118 family)
MRFAFAWLVAALLVAITSVGGAAAAPSGGYVVHPLVSNTATEAGNPPDPHLVNAWGLAAGPGTPWWVNDNGAGLSTLYNAAGVKRPLEVSVGDGPTGLVFNDDTTGFKLQGGDQKSALFIFDGEDGVVRAWNPSLVTPAGTSSAETEKDLSGEGAVFKGLAISDTRLGPRLYATDFHNRRVDVFDDSWKQIKSPFAFFDPTIPSNYGPFGIQAIGHRIFVTYAKTQPNSDDEAHGQGLGFVDAFDDATGILVAKVAIHGQLNAPWGLAWAPASFRRFGGDLLVGNFGDGQIHAYKPILGGLLFVPQGELRTVGGDPVFIDGLWALQFGMGNLANNGPTDTLFFTAGPDDESNGLFGSITAGEAKRAVRGRRWFARRPPPVPYAGSRPGSTALGGACHSQGGARRFVLQSVP